MPSLFGGTTLFGPALTDARRHTLILTAVSGNTDFRIFKSDPGAAFTVDNISVRELLGNHATQATLASRPALGRVPFGGRRNLLTHTEQFDNAAWVKTNATVTANAAVAPDGTTTADKLIETATTGVHFAEQVPVMGASPHTASAYFKAAEYATASIFLTQSGNNGAVFDLAAGTVVSVTTGAGNTAAIVDAGNGWYRCSVTNNGSADISDAVRFGPRNSALVPTNSGDGTSGVLIWGAQLETTATATAYQKVVTALDVTEAGVEDCYYLAFDGTDDFLVTGNIDFSATDEMTVIAGVRKLSDAAAGLVAELSTDSASNAGTFGMFASSTGASYTWRSRGTTDGIANTPLTFPAPITNVVTGLGDISNDQSILRVNGSQSATATSDQGTGNYAAAQPLYIGRRGGTTLPFNGHLYGLIVRGKTTAGTDLTNAESYMARKTGVYTLEQLNQIATLNSNGTSFLAYAAADANSNNYLVPKTVLN